MIQLEQIQRLEARINQAIALISRLKGENETLRRTLDSAQEKVQRLEGLVGEFKSDQKEIEACIVRALENLDRLEDELPGSAGATKEPAPERTGRKRPEPAPEAARADAEAASEAAPEGPREGDGELDIF